ncbi:MAG: zinc-dependent metalloprotease [Planctomycetota bacterium]|nr:zinc-dependent metalloprotease [Planctomycetota bacterium]
MSFVSDHKSLIAAGLIGVFASAVSAKPKKFEEVNDGYTQVVSTVDGSKPLFGLWMKANENQLLAELPQGWNRKKFFIAVTPSAGVIFSGLQGNEDYVYLRRYDDRLAFISPEISVRSTGDKSSKDSVDTIFTDTVLLDVPIVATGPNGQPVIDLDSLLVGNASKIAGPVGSGVNSRLASIVKAKSFPKNLEVAFEMPTSGGKLKTIHYSISEVPERGSYKPRKADERVGYFTTSFRDLGQYHDEDKWVHFINRWDLQKRDPKLTLSPPKKPLVFYIEHTVPVRYRRWVRDGILYWNDAFRKIGIDNAIEVNYQDAATGAHMDKDPEDVRYNFLRWLHNDVATAIGPSRAHPMTGELLDADIVLTDGWIRAYWRWYTRTPLSAESMTAFTPEDIQWLEDYPDWDPRLRMASPIERAKILAERATNKTAGETDPANSLVDPMLAVDKELAEIAGWLGDADCHCLAASQLASQMAFARLSLETLSLLEDGAPTENARATGDELDGIPEWFIGPLMSGLVAHEVGHTLGLRHNFKASSLYSFEEINSDEIRGKKPFTSSVMDYNPVNFNMDTGETQGDFAMIGIGPYDFWAIEYGYTFDKPEEVLNASSDPMHAYLTDEDTGGPDPLAKRYDFSKDPLVYAENQMRIINKLREDLLESFVKDGDSWSKARRGYETTLRMQLSAASMMTDWIGGAHTNRNKKGDFENGEHPPVEVVPTNQQRAALHFVVNTILDEKAYGLSSDLITHFNVDKWYGGGGDDGEATWPIHDRILGSQASTLSALLAPSRLGMVYDNEFRIPSEEDALTVAEIFETLMDSVYGGLDEADGEWSNRRPMISSMKRNLQAEMADRLVDLSTGRVSMFRTIRTLALHHTRQLHTQIGEILQDRSRLDTYTLSHLEDMHERLGNALDIVYTM